MNINELVQNLSPEVYQNLKTAVEIGKWPDGTALTPEQQEHTLQLVMVYQSKVLKSTEHYTVGQDGEIVNRSKDALKNQFKDQLDEAQGIARFKHDDI